MDCIDFIAELKANVDAFEDAPLTPETDFAALPVWDSLALISTMALISSGYGVQLSGDEIARCKTVAQLWELVEARK